MVALEGQCCGGICEGILAVDHLVLPRPRVGGLPRPAAPSPDALPVLPDVWDCDLGGGSMNDATFRQRCACSAEAEGPSQLVKAWWVDHRNWCSWAAEFQRYIDKLEAEAARRRAEGVTR